MLKADLIADPIGLDRIGSNWIGGELDFGLTECIQIYTHTGIELR